MRQRSPRDHLLTVAMVLFAAGLVALAVTFGLFASGHRRLPIWLSLSSLLLPLGLVLGMVRTRGQAAGRARRQPDVSPPGTNPSDNGSGATPEPDRGTA